MACCTECHCHTDLIFPSESQYFKHFNQIKTFHRPAPTVSVVFVIVLSQQVSLSLLKSPDNNILISLQTPSFPSLPLLHLLECFSIRSVSWPLGGEDWPGLWLTLYLWTGYLLLITSIIITSQSPLSTELLNASYKVLGIYSSQLKLCSSSSGFTGLFFCLRSFSWQIERSSWQYESMPGPH